MPPQKIKIILPGFILLVLCVYGVYNLITRQDIIQEAKIVTGVDKNMVPLKATDLFPKGTSKVCVWISWHNAKINTRVLVKWHYITDDIPIDNYTFILPKKQGVANVFLSMPESKSMPSGLYKADIFLGKTLTKTLDFEIE